MIKDVTDFIFVCTIDITDHDYNLTYYYYIGTAVQKTRELYDISKTNEYRLWINIFHNINMSILLTKFNLDTLSEDDALDQVWKR